MATPLRPSAGEVPAGMAALAAKQAEWASVPLAAKADMLQEVKMRTLDITESWGRAVSTVKGLEENATAGPGEVVKIAAIVLGMMNRVIGTLRHLAKHGRPPVPPVRVLPSGQLAAKVFPISLADRLDTFGVFGIEAEVWIQPGKAATQGSSILANKEGGLAVVLAAGNHSYIGLMDALEQLFLHNRVTVLKYHDVQAPLTPILEYVLAPLRERGYCWGVEADIEVAQALLYHPLTSHVHMTGGNATHDAVVWGPPGPERQRRMRDNAPLLKVPISSELGNISPWLVTPGGAWTERQLSHHAKALTEALLDNCSCNCLAAKLVVLSDEWEHADAFVAKLKQEIRSAPPLPPYYPGCRERQAAFLEKYPATEVLRSTNPAYSSRCGVIPVAMLERSYESVPGGPQDEYFLNVEPFSPVITILRLPASKAAAAQERTVEFLHTAVQFCNTAVWGNLTCTLLVHPDVQAAHREDVEKAIAALQYGLVAVNTWGGVGFASEVAFWGGFQGGQSLQNPMSGIGSSHNAYMLDHPQKSVVRAPFICGLHPMPQYLSPLPIPLPVSLSTRSLWVVAKIFAGYLASGVLGIFRVLLKSAPTMPNAKDD